MTLFSADSIRANALVASDIPALQVFFEENPEYFLAVNGSLPHQNEAQQAFDDLPPAEMSFNKKWLIGFTDDAEKIIGIAGVVSDLLAEHVWHIGTFIVATSLHGTGVAQKLYTALETWMASNGAQRIRLGVVEGNTPAERFWLKVGYHEVRKRLGVKMGTRTNTIRVLVRSLSNGTTAQYLSLVERDNPNSTLR